MILPERLSALVVDDNAYARSAATATLRKLGIGTVTEANGGGEAAGLIATMAFDVVVTDWYMPEVSGAGLIQIATDARINKGKTPAIIVMTAYANRENVLKARELGAGEVIAKPFSTDQMAVALGRVLPAGWGSAAEGSAAATAATGKAEEDKFFL